MRGPLTNSVNPAEGFGHCPLNTAARSMLPTPRGKHAPPVRPGAEDPNRQCKPPPAHGARRRRTGDSHHE
ncbi:hypothetical protein CBM2608_A50288 [Cupriavidus taiwanensis]|nr:hypothetical protein CBM2608_A50288 [Cupriavidus taiwanensis]